MSEVATLHATLQEGLSMGAALGVVEMETITPIPLSVLIRTLNEADRLAGTLESVTPLGAEIVIIDAGSSDSTVEIAHRYGAKVFTNPWPGFGPQRRFGEEKCSHDLIFSVDADEILPPKMVAEIRGRLLRADSPRLMIVRKAITFPHHSRPPPLAYGHEQILIYDRRIARTGLNPNWDKLEITEPAKVERVREPLWHFSMRNLEHQVIKHAKVGQLAADTQPERGRLQLVARLITEFPLAFLKYYFARRYFLAGADGFTAAVVGAFSRFIRIAMMLERKDYGPRGSQP